MSKMADMHTEINDMLSNTQFMIDEIAFFLDVPVNWVEEVVLERWEKIKESAGVEDMGVIND
jgi:hypothetical protein